jgi:hypothetical protein
MILITRVPHNTFLPRIRLAWRGFIVTGPRPCFWGHGSPVNKARGAQCRSRNRDRPSAENRVERSGGHVEALIRKTCKTHRVQALRVMCTSGEPTRPGVGSPSRKRHTQYVEHNCGREGLQEQGGTRRGSAMEGQPQAPKSVNTHFLRGCGGCL